MKYILISIFLNFILLHADTTYPLFYAKLGTPLYIASDKFIPLKKIDTLETLVNEYIKQVEQTMAIGVKIDTSSDKTTKKNYLKKLRSLQQSHDKIIALSKRSLINAMQNKDYAIFSLITDIDIKQLFKKQRLNNQIIAFYKQHKEKYKSDVIERLISEKKTTPETYTSLNTNNMTNEMLYNEAKDLINNSRRQINNLTKAIQLTQEILNREPDNMLGLISKARLLLHIGQPYGYDFNQETVLEAQKIFTYVQKNKPNLFDAYYFAAYSFIVDKRDSGLNKAKEMVIICKNLKPQSLRTHLLYLAIARKEKSYVELINIAKYILEKTKEPWMINFVHNQLTNTYWAQKKYKLAEKSYLKIIEVSPDSPWALSNYASFLNRRKDYDKAILHGEKALSMLDYGLVHYVLARAYYKKGAYLHWDKKERKESRKYFLKAIEHNPELSSAYYGLGMSYYHTGYKTKNVNDLRKSKLALEKTLQLNPNHKQAHKQLTNITKLLNIVEN